MLKTIDPVDSRQIDRHKHSRLHNRIHYWLCRITQIDIAYGRCPIDIVIKSSTETNSKVEFRECLVVLYGRSLRYSDFLEHALFL